jgi:ADP-ribosylglycohydrolase
MSKSAETREFEAVGLFELAAPTRSEELFPPILGSLVAAASADALGWVTEFMRSPASLNNQLGVDRLTNYVSWNKKVGGRFNTYIDFVGRGEYSDDTQLTLAVARALNQDGRVDHELLREARAGTLARLRPSMQFRRTPTRSEPLSDQCLVCTPATKQFRSDGRRSSRTTRTS